MYKKRRQTNHIIIQEKKVTAVRQIIYLTQDEEKENFGNLPDDTLLQIQLPKNQNNSQKPRCIMKKLYKK